MENFVCETSLQTYETQRETCETASKNTSSCPYDNIVGPNCNEQEVSRQTNWNSHIIQGHSVENQDAYFPQRESHNKVTSGGNNVIVELQETKCLNPPSTLTSLKIKMSQEIRDNKMVETEANISNTDSVAETSIICGGRTGENVQQVSRRVKETAKNTDKRVKTKGHSKRKENSNTRSHGVHKSRVRSDRKYNTRNKGHLSDESDSDINTDERSSEAVEPEVRIRCKAKYIKLRPISKSDLEGKDLYVEVEIDKDLIVSPIEKYDCSSGRKSKYTFKVSSSKCDSPVKRKSHSGTNTSADNFTKVKKLLKRKTEEKKVTSKGDVESEETKKRKIKVEETSSLPLKKSSQTSGNSVAACGTDTDTDHGTVMNESEINDIKPSPSQNIIANSDSKEAVKTDTPTEMNAVESKLQKHPKKKTKKKNNSLEKKQAKSIEYSTRVTEDG